MPRGGPDYGLETTNLGQYSTDIAELAARMGSPYSVYRSGHVLYITDFQTGGGDWSTSFGGGFGSIARAINGWNGPTCLGLLPNTVGVAYSTATKLIPLTNKSKVGSEVFIQWEDTGLANKSIFRLSQLVYIAPNSYVASIFIDPAAFTLVIESDNPVIGGLVTITNKLDVGRGYWIDNCYHWIKLVVDWSKGYYDTLYFDDQVIDLSGYTPWNVHALGVGYNAIVVQAKANAQSDWVDIGSAIVTVDEP